MSMPTINDVHFVDPVLQNMLVGFANQQNSYAALTAFAQESVGSKSGTYPILTKKYWFVDGLQERAPGAPYVRGGIGVESTTYETMQWGREYTLADEVEAARQFNYSLATAGVRWLAHQSFIRKERILATKMVSGIWTTTNTTDTDWDDGSGVPVTDVADAQAIVMGLTGLEPRDLLMGKIVFNALKVNAQITAKIQYTTTQTVSNVEGLLASVLGVDRIIVSRAMYNSANEGQAGTLAAIIDDDALLYYNDMGASGEGFMATAAKWLLWNPGGGAGAQSTYYDNTVDSQIIKHKEQHTLEVIAADLGHLWTDIV